MKTLGQKIKELRKALKATQLQVGKAVGVSHVTISQWEKDETSPKGENLYKLARVLNCEVEELLYGKLGETVFKDSALGLGNVIPSITNTKMIPVISSIHAGAWHEAYESIYAEEWRETSAKVGNRAFCLKVIGDSMTNPSGFPSIPEGSYVIVDPDAEVFSGNIVVAKLVDDNEVTLKKFVQDGPNRYLVPLNPNYKPIQINGNCRIVGVVKKMEIDF